jgi:hypothetical protein
MSEGGEGGASAEGSSCEAGGLETVVQDSDTSNESCESEAEYSPSEEPKSEYNSKERKIKGESKAQKSKQQSKKAGEKKENSETLDDKLSTEAFPQELESLYYSLIKEGMTKSDAKKIVAMYKASTNREEYSHNWTTIEEWVARIDKYKNKNFFDGIKGMWYLANALVDVTSAEDTYKKIDEGASLLYIPGYLAIPRDTSAFEKAIGRKVARIETTDIGEIRKIVQYAAEKHGRVQIVGFSDGGQIISDYIKKYGDDYVDRFYAVAANPVKSNSSRVTHIIGSKDYLAPLEQEYNYSKTSAYVYDGGHTFAFMDNTAMKQIGSVISSMPPSRAYYTIRHTSDSPLFMRKAA